MSHISPEDYLAVGDGAANDDTPCRNMLDAIIAASGGHVIARPGAIYRLDLTGYAAGFNWKTLYDKRFVLTGNGATFNTQENLGAHGAWWLLFRPSHHVSVANTIFKSPSGLSSGGPRGITAFYCEDSRHSEWSNLEFDGFGAGIAITSTHPGVSKSALLSGCSFKNCFYPVILSGLESGTFGYSTHTVGRSLFIYSSEHLNIRLNSRDAVGNDVIMQAAAGLGSAAIEDTSVYYRGRAKGIAYMPEAVAMQVQRGTTSQGCRLINNSFIFDIEGDDSHAVGAAISLARLSSSGVDNSATAQHRVDGLHIDGRAVGTKYAQGIAIPAIGHLFQPTDWLGNITIGTRRGWFGRGHPSIGGASTINLDGTAVKRPVILQDIDIDGAITATNFAEGMLIKRGYGRSANMNW